MQIPLIDLDRIAAERAGVVTLNGVQHMVKPISAATLQLMRNAQPDNYLDISLTVVERCVPSIGAEDRQELIPAQLEAIVAIANGRRRRGGEARPKRRETDDGPGFAGLVPAR
jgi:hypothetical protein